MKKIEAIIKPFKVDEVKRALQKIGVTGMTLSNVKGFGNARDDKEHHRGGEYFTEFVPKIKLEIVSSDRDAEQIMRAIIESARTGSFGDGKIFISDLGEAVRVRTGESGDPAV